MNSKSNKSRPALRGSVATAAIACLLFILFSACTDYQDEFEDAFGDLEYAEETDDSSSSSEESSSDADEESSSSKVKSSSSSEGSSSSKVESSSSEKVDSSSSSEEEISSSSSSEAETDATLSMLMVFATDPSEEGASALLSKDSAELADSSSFNVFVQAPTAFIKVKPNAKKVAQVKLSVGKKAQSVQPDEDGVYTFETPELTILDTTRVNIEVKSEDAATTETYTLSIPSALTPPANLKLGRNAERNQIIVNFDRANDSRVIGYVILRSNRGNDGKHGKDLPDSIENKTYITDKGAYKDFTSFKIKADTKSYTDSTGGGSPYYTYRVYAYRMEGEDMVFSVGTDSHTRSVGRIKVDYKMTDFGAEYFYVSGGGRADIIGNATLYEGSNKSGTELHSWEGYDYCAGLASSANTIIYLSSEFDAGRDVMPDNQNYWSNIGSAGLYLQFDISTDYSSYSNDERASQGIYWPYENMAKVLNGESNLATGRNGDAPERIPSNQELREYTEYLVGQGGIEYHDNDNKCNGCGDEPHAGFWFGFKYDWVDDDDTY